MNNSRNVDCSVSGTVPFVFITSIDGTSCPRMVLKCRYFVIVVFRHNTTTRGPSGRLLSVFSKWCCETNARGAWRHVHLQTMRSRPAGDATVYRQRRRTDLGDQYLPSSLRAWTLAISQLC